MAYTPYFTTRLLSCSTPIWGDSRNFRVVFAHFLPTNTRAQYCRLGQHIAAGKTKTPSLPLPSVECHVRHRLSARGVVSNHETLLYLSSVYTCCQASVTTLQLPHDHATPRAEVHLVARLHDPAGFAEQAIDVLSGKLFGSGHRRTTFGAILRKAWREHSHESFYDPTRHSANRRQLNPSSFDGSICVC